MGAEMHEARKGRGGGELDEFADAAEGLSCGQRQVLAHLIEALLALEAAGDQAGLERLLDDAARRLRSAAAV
jgi:hypothetical protein